MKKITFFLALVILMTVKSAAQNTLVPFNATWKYLDDGSDQGTAWRDSSYDDTSWKSGPAILGFGNPTALKEATLVSFGPDSNNIYITTYIRKTISLASAFASFTGSLKRDDGAVVYVNGLEVFRSNLPDSTIAYNTLATYADDNGTLPQAFTIPGSAFTTGINVIAVELHQHSNSSSDMTFDLELLGNDSIPAGDREPPTVLSLNRQLPATETTNSANYLIFRATFSEAVTGVDAADFALELSGATTATIASVAAHSGTTFDVVVSGISGSGTLGMNLNAGGTGIADAAGNAIGGGFTGQAYTIDQTLPAVLSLHRQSPTTDTTTAPSLVFRASFSEAVTGVDATDFALVLGGTATGTIASAVATDTGMATYDITVNSVAGSGTLGLNLKANGTDIADAAGNTIGGGFTGQAYTINPIPIIYGFASVTNLKTITSRVDATKGRPQAKVFTNAGRHWAIIASTGGTYLWRLDGTAWTNILKLSTRNTRADCIVDGNVTHIFLFAGKNSELFSVEYVPEKVTYVPWSKRKTKIDLLLDDGVETGTIALDATGRLWLASDAITDINVRYSDAPYTSWSLPITIGAGIDSDDVSAIIALPGKIGVLWGNQKTKRFGFRTHTDGQDPAAWSADEVPASQSALNEGKGMADDHLDLKVTSDGTLYCAVKTGYDKAGYTKIALLVRRPAGIWDNLYGVSEQGTAPIVVVNEALGKVKVIYTSQTYGGDILYKETSMSNISFGQELTLISGINNYATATHQLYSSEVVILASNTEQTSGVLASDVPPMPGLREARAASLEQALAPANLQQPLQAYPNPLSTKAMIRFVLATDSPYTLTLYDGKMGELVSQKQGTARAGEQNSIELDGSGLSGGIYVARLQTNEFIKTLKVLVNK